MLQEGGLYRLKLQSGWTAQDPEAIPQLVTCGFDRVGTPAAAVAFDATALSDSRPSPYCFSLVCRVGSLDMLPDLPLLAS